MSRLKEDLKKLIRSKNRVPDRFRRGIIWLIDGDFGLNRRNNIIFFNKKGRKKGRKEYTLKTFFVKQRLQPCMEKEIIKRVNEYLLFSKIREGTLRAKEIILCRNAEIRAFLLERFGYDKFLAELKGDVIHKDGLHSLIKIDWHKEEEPIKLVRVRDSSSGKFYALRVPLHMRTCKQAVAWTFGLEKDQYQPVIET